MKGAVLRKIGSPLVLETLPDPHPGAGEVVVQVAAAPVLAYAREVFDGTRNYPLLVPLVPGCGAVGTVLETGPDATRLQVGDWVFCDPTVRSRDDAVSPDIMLQGLIAPDQGAQRMQAHFRNGAFAERMLIPMENAARIGPPGELDPAKLCALNTLLVPYGGLLAAALQPGQTVLISGATGHFGSAAVAVALAMGAGCVVACGRESDKLEGLVERFGPRMRAVRLGGNEQDDTRAMREAARGPIDVVFDQLPPIQDTTPVRTAVMAVRAHGTVVLMGGVQADIALPYGHLMRQCITVRGQFMYPRDAPERMMGLIRTGLLSLDAFHFTSFGLDKIADAVEHAATDGGIFRMTVVRP